jgi:DNA-binding NtrC family response regulator
MAEHILIVDDEHNLRITLHEILTAAGFATSEAQNAREALQLLHDMSHDLVLSDWKMPVADGEYLLRGLSERHLIQRIPVVVMTAHGTGNNAMRAIQLGAYDFITKPLDFDELLATVRRAINHLKLQREIEELRATTIKTTDDGTDYMIGSARSMVAIYKDIGRVAPTDASVLLLGESGSGKDVVARAIHRHSLRSNKPFVIINCAALPAELLESELFGHEKGAFTGAINRKLGKFESANGGTVFLDEIGELSLSLQPKLLRVLQERSFERIGSSETQSVDFRVVAATNRSLEEEVAEKRFRSDLLFRLQVFTITLPPLRERRTDILPLSEYFLQRFADRNGFIPSGFTEDAVLLLQQYSYPGNVRELEHLIERAAILARGRVITKDILATSLPVNRVQSGIDELDQLLRLPFHESVAMWERKLIENALNESLGNKADAARRLRVQRRLLYEKLKALGLDSRE